MQVLRVLLAELSARQEIHFGGIDLSGFYLL